MKFPLDYEQLGKKYLTNIALDKTIIIITTLSVIILFALNIGAEVKRNLEQKKITKSLEKVSVLQWAVELYKNDMGFYPPDVPRGWDPGFLKPFPWNPESNEAGIIRCKDCPRNWKKIISKQWNGPYITEWPNKTPWNGKYDYNYWKTVTDRYGCMIPAGIYIGIQKDYKDQHPLDMNTEQGFVNSEANNDKCINGEIQFLIANLKTSKP